MFSGGIVMSIFGKAAASKSASEKMVRLHIIIVVIVCVVFGIINAVSGTVLTGMIIQFAKRFFLL